MLNVARRAAPLPVVTSKPAPARPAAVAAKPVDSFVRASATQATTVAQPFAPWLSKLYQEHLHRPATAAELTAGSAQIAAILAQGKNIFEAGAALDFGMRISPEYAQVHPMGNAINGMFNDAFGRYGTPQEIDKTEELVRTLGAQGKNIFEIGAIVSGLMKWSPEYAKAHPFAPWINETFGQLLGREPNGDELRKTEKVISDCLAQGKNIFEAGAVVQYLIKLGPEYQQGAGNVRGRILDIAQGEVGTVEATNNNDGDVAKYPGFFGRGPESYCANFVSYVLSKAGAPADFYNTETMKNAWMNDGKYKGRDNPQPGDVVWFDWDGDGITDHVGLVKGVNGDGSIRTIEGNTGGPGGQEGVWEQDRDMGVIVGFGSPT
jgi:hypothetical protein